MVNRIELDFERLYFSIALKVLIQLRWCHLLRYLTHENFVLKSLVRCGCDLPIKWQGAARFPFGKLKVAHFFASQLELVVVGDFNPSRIEGTIEISDDRWYA